MIDFREYEKDYAGDICIYPGERLSGHYTVINSSLFIHPKHDITSMPYYESFDFSTKDIKEQIHHLAYVGWI